MLNKKYISHQNPTSAVPSALLSATPQQQAMNGEQFAQAAISNSSHPHGLASTLMDDQFVGMDFITQFTGLTDKWFYKLIQENKFPKPIKFGRSSRWLKSEVASWVQERIQSSRPEQQT